MATCRRRKCQRAANEVRGIARLFDARMTRHLWAQTLRSRSGRVFAIQSEIARRLLINCRQTFAYERKRHRAATYARSGGVRRFQPGESLLLTASVSANDDAGARCKAIELLDESVKRDPSFFDAYSSSPGRTNNFMQQVGLITLPPGLPSLRPLCNPRHDCGRMLPKRIWRAHNISYYGLRDYASRLAELEIARRALPNDPRLFELTGFILRRRGQQEKGLQNLQRAVELDPRNFFTLQQIALSYQQLGRYAEAIAALNRASAIGTRQRRNAGRTCRKNFTSSGKETPGRSIKRLTQSLHKGRAPSPAPPTLGSFARWPNAIRVRPNTRAGRAGRQSLLGRGHDYSEPQLW